MQAYLAKAADAAGTVLITLLPETPEERAALDLAVQAKAEVKAHPPGGSEIVVRVIPTVLG